MRYINIEEYRKTNFSPESRPTIPTIRTWIKKGYIRAIKRGRSFFIECDTEIKKASNPLVDQVLRDR